MRLDRVCYGATRSADTDSAATCPSVAPRVRLHEAGGQSLTYRQPRASRLTSMVGRSFLLK